MAEWSEQGRASRTERRQAPADPPQTPIHSSCIYNTDCNEPWRLPRLCDCQVSLQSIKQIRSTKKHMRNGEDGGPASMCRHSIFHVCVTVGLPTLHSILHVCAIIGFHNNIYIDVYIYSLQVCSRRHALVQSEALFGACGCGMSPRTGFME